MERILDRKITRRTALGGGAKIVVGAAAFPFLKSDTNQRTIGEPTSLQRPNQEPFKNPLVQQDHEQQEIPHKEEEEHGSIANDYSAYGVTFAFAGSVLSVASGKMEFGAGTVSAVSAAEGVRLALLARDSSNAFKKEVEELATSYPLIPVLALMADATDNMRIYLDTLFEKPGIPETTGESLALEETHEGKHEIIKLSQRSTDEAKIYQERHKEEILRLAAATSALSTVFAPVLTTYTSATATTDSFEPMLRALTKAHYAQEVIRKKEASEEIDDQSLMEDALEKALHDMNGPQGYSNLSLAESANLNGLSVIGDPPFVASLAINKFDLKGHAYVSAKGALFSQASSLAANINWLRSTELSFDSKSYAGDFVEYQQKTVLALGRAFTTMRDASIGGLTKESSDLAKRLEAIGMSHGPTQRTVARLQEKLKAIDHPIFQIDAGEFVGLKANALGRLPQDSVNNAERGFKPAGKILGRVIHGAKKSVEISREAGGKVIRIARGKQSPKTLGYGIDIDQVTQALSDMDEILKDENIHKLEDVFTKIFNADEGEVNGELIEELKHISSKVSEGGPRHLTEKYIKIAHDLQITDREVEDISALLGVVGPNEVKAALNSTIDKYRGVTEKHKSEALYGHTATEVANALLTQLAAVPSLVHIAEKVLDKTYGLNSKEEFDPKTVDKMVASVLATTGMISAFADNVAAYLFGRKLLMDIFEKVYGERFHKNFFLRQYANDAALIMATTAGDETKIGNGPNFHIFKLDAELSENRIVAKRKKLDLVESMKNPYAHVQSATVLALLMAEKKVLDKTLRKAA